MSARSEALISSAGPRVIPVGAAAAAGLLLLLGRQLTTSPAMLLLILAVVGMLAVTATVEPLDPAAIPTGWVIAGGAGLVTAAAVLQGPGVPTPTTSWVLPLGLVAAVAEEALFRRLIYGGLRRWGVPVAVTGSALLFALVHVPTYGAPAFWVDLGAGLLFGWQRWASGGWAAPAATHAAANLLAVLR